MSILFRQLNHNPQSSQPDWLKRAGKWLKVSCKSWQRLSEHQQQCLSQRVTEGVETQFAQQTIADLQAKVERRPGKDIRWGVKLIVTIAGAFAFGSGMRLIASNLGPYATPAGLIGGATASVVVDHLATAAHTNQQKRQRVEKQLAAIAQQQQTALAGFPDHSPLLVQSFAVRRDMVLAIEGTAIQSSVPVNAIAAGVLSGVEYAVALWIVESAVALAGIPLPIRAIAAGLPVILTHGAAAAQGLLFGLPDYCEDILPQYRQRLSSLPQDPTDPLTSARFELLVREFEDGGVEAMIHNILERPTEPTPILARLAYERDFLAKGAEQLEGQRQSAIAARLKQFNQAKAKLGAQFPMPETEVPGYNAAELGALGRQVDEQRQQWEQTEAEVLKDQLLADLEVLNAEYRVCIEAWQGWYDEAQVAYDNQYAQWRRQPQAIDVEFEMAGMGQEQTV